MSIRNVYKCPFIHTEICPNFGYEGKRINLCWNPLVTDQHGKPICRIDIDTDIVTDNEKLKKSLSNFKFKAGE